MKKLLPLLSVLFLLITVTPILAKSDSSNLNADEEVEFKNHGQFVSSIAKTHPGGDEVSEAARSSVGKKDHDDDQDEDEDEDEDNDDENNASPTPCVSPSPSVSPSPLVSPSPDVSPTPEASPSPSISPSPSPLSTTQEQITFLESLVARLNAIIDSLKNLL